MNSTMLLVLLLLLSALLPHSNAIVIQYFNDTEILGHRTATFGPAGGTYNVTGKLVVAPPPFTGCAEWTNVQSDIIKGNILVLLRGDCAFVKKAWLAQKAGAVGVVVGNNIRTPNLDEKFTRMGPDYTVLSREQVEQISIPAVFVPNESLGLLMLVSSFDPKDFNVYIDSRGEYIPINSGNSQAVIHFGNIVRMVMFLAAVFPLLWMCYLGSGVLRNILLGCFNRCERKNRLLTIPTVVYSSEHCHEKQDPDYVVNNGCVICLDDFMDGQRVKRLPCNHAFCQNCIMMWLEDRSDQCPICKRSILGDSEESSASLCVLCFQSIVRRIRVCWHRRSSRTRRRHVAVSSVDEGMDEFDLENL
jgi:hypothetical protein